MFKIQLLSDIHQEIQQYNHETTNANLLILAGDIDGGSTVVNFVEQKFGHENVLYVPGNHEYYGCRDWVEARATFTEGFAVAGIKTLINPGDYHIINGVVFMGGTLWTDLRWRPSGQAHMSDYICKEIVKEALSDYYYIGKNIGIRGLPHYDLIIPDDTQDMHFKFMRGMEEIYDKYKDTHDFVVVSHHAPSEQSSLPFFRSKTSSAAYCSNLENWIMNRPKIKVWCHGHVHNSNDYMIGQCRVVTNPRGYASTTKCENEQFNPKFTFEV